MHHPQRELDIAAALKVLLEPMGVSSAIVSYRFNDYQTMASWNPRVVVLPWYYGEEKGFNRYRQYWPSTRFVNMAYEQIYSKIHEAQKVIHGPYARSQMRFSAWGMFYEDYLANIGIPRSAVSINGNPSYGLYRAPYSRYFVDRAALAARHGLDPQDRWVFFPENYRAAFMSPEQLDRFEKAEKVPGIGNSFRDFAEASLREVCSWLAETPAGVQVILRPRPAVGMEPFVAKVGPWVQAAGKRVHITTDATVREWILASDVVVSSYSTSLIETSLTGKPIHMLEPVPFPDYVMNDWYSLVERVRTKEEFAARVLAPGPGGDSSPLRQWAEDTNLPNGDPILRTAEWVRDCVRETPAAPDRRALALKARMRQAGDALKWKLRGQREKIPMKDWFDPGDADARVEKWRGVLA